MLVLELKIQKINQLKKIIENTFQQKEKDTQLLSFYEDSNKTKKEIINNTKKEEIINSVPKKEIISPPKEITSIKKEKSIEEEILDGDKDEI